LFVDEGMTLGVLAWTSLAQAAMVFCVANALLVCLVTEHRDQGVVNKAAAAV
jgi:hypothetical protein